MSLLIVVEGKWWLRFVVYNFFESDGDRWFHFGDFSLSEKSEAIARQCNEPCAVNNGSFKTVSFYRSFEKTIFRLFTDVRQRKRIDCVHPMRSKSECLQNHELFVSQVFYHPTGDFAIF